MTVIGFRRARIRGLIRALGRTGLLLLLCGCSRASERETRLLNENRALKLRVTSLEAELSQLRGSVLPAGSFPQTLIIPGRTLGGFVLGQPLPMGRLAALGPPRRDGKIPGDVFVWPARPKSSDPAGYDLMVKTRQATRTRIVGAIHTTSDQYRTSEGLGVGSSMPAVQQAFPEGLLGEGPAGPCWTTPLISFCTQDGQLVSEVILGQASK